MAPAPKSCVCCGRTITWRRKWERDWDQVRYCSASCRRRGVSEADLALEQDILVLVRVSGNRAVDLTDAGLGGRSSTTDPEALRRAARRLVASGVVELLQHGRVVDPSTARGPVQVRRRRGGADG